MPAPYLPPSKFLKEILRETIPLSGGEMAEAHLSYLIEMTRDEDPINRDWATLLLAQEEIDTPAIRDALIRAAGDEQEIVRAEAVLGLAMRDPALALPFVQEALRGAAIS